MSSNITVVVGTDRRIILAGLLTLTAGTAMAQSIAGTATYRERMALPPAAVFEAAIEDVSRADASAETIARTRVASPGNPPIAFTIPYDPAMIVANRRYVVRARIHLGEELLFTSDTAAPVITDGNPTKVSLLLRRVGAGQTPPRTPGGTATLEQKYWRAIELAAKPVTTQDPRRAPYLEFQAGGRVSGSDGCNRITGTYQLDGERVAFGELAWTQKACLDTSETEGLFRGALKNAARLTVAGDRLELFDAAGTRLATFAAASGPSANF